MQIIVCGASSERGIARELIDTMSGRATDRTGDTTLPELIRVIDRAVFVLTNDTSAAHIASALDVKAVCVVGGGHAGRFLPYPASVGPSTLTCVTLNFECAGCNWVCKFDVPDSAPKPCVSDISVEMVWNAVQSSMSAVYRV
jgi:ADP-heptose:LPS heptosyltransferase